MRKPGKDRIIQMNLFGEKYRKTGGIIERLQGMLLTKKPVS
jgi:hypothetical protein